MPNYVSKELNQICTEAGVQCTVTMDPTTFKKVYQFRNVSLHKVEVTMDKAVFVMYPNDVFNCIGEEPKITQWFVSYLSAIPVPISRDSIIDAWRYSK